MNTLNGEIAGDLGSHIGTFGKQHVDYVLRVVIAEQLSELLLAIGYALLFNQCNQTMLTVLP